MSLLRVGVSIVRVIRLSSRHEKKLLTRPLLMMENNCHRAGSSRIPTTAAATDDHPRNVSKEEWLKKLTPEQYTVCREQGTEEPFSGKYYKHQEEGLYTCICCGADLFSSKTKYDSGTGWPSFYEPVTASNNDGSSTSVLTRPDNSTGTIRTEVLCKKCDSHLGHVFSDGPQPTGKRYCINSVSLKFVAKKLS